MKLSTAIAFGLATIAAIVVLSASARADTLYQCTGGSTMKFVETDRSMLVTGPDGVVTVLPWAGAMGRFATWSPGGMDAVGERVAPFAEYWQPKSGPAQIVFNVGGGEQTCEEVKS
jgi:hypothetical protein